MDSSNFLPKITMSDYTYDLPDDKIANFPLDQRDSSKLLVFRKGIIEDNYFNNLPNCLPANSTLILNNTKVIPARLLFHLENYIVEVFLLEPQVPDWSVWHCMVGNRKKFKEGTVLSGTFSSVEGISDVLQVSWVNRENNLIKLETTYKTAIAEAIEILGSIPLPPYINREANENDKERYQTVFASLPGAVAAPTASLHFSEEILNQIKSTAKIEYLTLHVGAGTFKPVTAETANMHVMHKERFTITSALVKCIRNAKGPIIPVGTTSLRVMESLYYIGVGLLKGFLDFSIIKSDVGYNPGWNSIPASEAFEALDDYLSKNNGTLSGETSIFIMPGFHFRVANSLITNFHQPQSTLILLVAAFIGDHWRDLYNHALANNYRFLSYGDSSFLIP